MAQVAIRVDDQLRDEATVLFQKLGLDMSTAFRMFLVKCVRTQGIPFELTINPGDYDDSGVYITDSRLEDAKQYLSEYARIHGRKGSVEELFDEEW